LRNVGRVADNVQVRGRIADGVQVHHASFGRLAGAREPVLHPLRHRRSRIQQDDLADIGEGEASVLGDVERRDELARAQDAG
jgi:hypothetical protein